MQLAAIFLPQADHDTPDEYLEQRVAAALSRLHVPVSPSLDVRARGGTVVLSGIVTSVYEKRIAGVIARRVPGVFEVIDHVRITERRAAATELVAVRVGA